ncbi:tyrosine-type recombinase/integrase [Blastopirellula sp. J2-11]|uniref:tyrosine-type recombinase/integrase n=1 Tax=Blastopirellula sp. J2-11 TaxID=2943192 RepID=UPI0021C5A618|nr:tyrosine-type recombinase/integrase [Blastopirellula sp. J2-11]UUO08697.1 tyrosine-type recombinase/integrase [Blastopirellula sp. J2-11]
MAHRIKNDSTTATPPSTQNQVLPAILFLYEHVLKQPLDRVELHYAFERKSPQVAFDFRWKYVFPDAGLSVDPRSRIRRRHYLHESTLSKAISAATRRAHITKRVTAHPFRHSFATHLIEAGYDIHTVQELLDYIDISTMMIFNHILNQGGRGVRSPADFDSLESE